MQESNRVYHTKESLRHALVALLEVQEVGHIKAVDVYMAARVSKATFYRYYHDVYDLLVECFEVYLDVQDEVRLSIESANLPSMSYELTLMGVRKIKQNPRLYLSCIQCTYAPFIKDFTERSTSLSQRSTRVLMDARGVTEATCAIDVDRLASLCIALSTDICVAWALGGCVESPEDIARLQVTCLTRFIDAMRIDE